MIINGVETSAFYINKVDSGIDSLNTLDSMVIQSLSDEISALQKVKDTITLSLDNPNLLSDPGQLTKIQAIIADYMLVIGLYEKMASSGLKAIDTLVKS